MSLSKDILNAFSPYTLDLPIPLESAPCANVEPKDHWGCKNGGKLVCGRCQLVRYCSKVSLNLALATSLSTVDLNICRQ